jgi:UDP-N-acetylmuramyl tripeptide synthase
VRLAVAIARAGDVLVATGKAHETTLCRGTTEYPYSEKESFLKLLR